MTDERVTLTLNERLILTNQYRILERLYPEEADIFRQLRTIVETGYELHYRDLHMRIDDSGLTEEASREVMDILDMFRALNDSFKTLKDKSSIDETKMQFNGFDGNHESALLSYAHFLIHTQGRWPEVLEGRPDFNLNSHFPVIKVYRRMLGEWNNIGKKFNLNRDEIQQILAARAHPENRS